MVNLDALTAFFGWMTVVNVTMFLIAAFSLMLFRRGIAVIHGGMFNLSEQELSPIYFRSLVSLKLLIFVLNLTPYLVLRFLV